MARIIGLVFSGFMVRAYATGFAIYTAYYAGTVIIDKLNAVNAALNAIG